jgi:ketosteroid isomerase-like protein
VIDIGEQAPDFAEPGTNGEVRLSDVWARGKVVLAFYTEDVIWYPFPDAPVGSDGLHGHAPIRDLMAGWTDSFEGFAVVTKEVRDLGDRALWLGEISGTIKGSNTPVRQPMGGVSWDFRGGKIGRARFFPSWEEALGAAGLQE